MSHHRRSTDDAEAVSTARDIFVQEIMSLSDGEFQREQIDMDSITFSGEEGSTRSLKFDSACRVAVAVVCTDILFLKHASSILKTVIKPCMWNMEEPSQLSVG